MTSDTVQLAWALVAGQLRHISEFRDVLQGAKPPATCEACGSTLIMKLGRIRAHHFAHQPGNRCALTAPETARHYNTKQLLASKLRSVDALSVASKCAFVALRGRCTTDIISVAAEAWDRVRVETYVEPFRPDIVLLKGERAVLAIEVRATHAVPDAKAQRLSERRIPWIEVLAGSSCDEWVSTSPLPVLRYECAEVRKLCPAHTAPKPLEKASAVSSPATPRRTQKSTGNAEIEGFGDRWRFRVIDCHPAEGPRVRKVFWIYSVQLNSFVYRLRVVDESTSSIVAQIDASEMSDESVRDLNQRLKEYLKRSFERLYSPQRWLERSAFPSNPATVYSKEYMPVKYHRDSEGRWS